VRSATACWSSAALSRWAGSRAGARGPTRGLRAARRACYGQQDSRGLGELSFLVALNATASNRAARARAMSRAVVHSRPPVRGCADFGPLGKGRIFTKKQNRPPVFFSPPRVRWFLGSPHPAPPPPATRPRVSPPPRRPYRGRTLSLPHPAPPPLPNAPTTSPPPHPRPKKNKSGPPHSPPTPPPSPPRTPSHPPKRHRGPAS
jgi:hypothetical protein